MNTNTNTNTNTLKRSKKFESEFRGQKSNPFYEKIKAMYTSGELRMLPSVRNLFDKVKFNKTTKLVRAGAFKAIESVENKIIEKKIIENKKINQEIKAQLNKQIIEKEQITQVKKSKQLLLNQIAQIKKEDVNRVTITKESITNRAHDWWIHQGEIKAMMWKNPNSFYTHSVTFYENTNERNTIKFNFAREMTTKDIKQHIIYKLFDGSDGAWVVSEFINENPSQNRVILTTTAYVRMADTSEQKRLLQNFKDNTTDNCVYVGLLKYFKQYSEKETISNGKRIYNKLVKGINKYSKAYTIEELDVLAKEINCSFHIKDLINKANTIRINVNSSNYYSIEFINTKYNHLDLNLCIDNNIKEVSDIEYNQLKLDVPFYVERCGKLTTLTDNYKVKPDEFKVLFDKWKKDNRISDTKISIDSDAFRMVNQYDDKIHRFFNNGLEINDTLYNEIDLKQAFFNYSKCAQYIGLPSGAFISCSGDGFTLDTFESQYSNKLVGFYEVEITHEFKTLEYYGIKSGSRHILFSSMVKLLSKYCEFKFINYTIAPGIDIKFGSEFEKTLIDGKLYSSSEITPELKARDGIKAYCKAVGLFGIDSHEIETHIKPLDDDKEFYNTLSKTKNNGIYNINGVVKIVEDIETPSSYKHLAYSIKAYSQTIIMAQLLKINYSDVFGVKVDSIVYKNTAVFDFAPEYTTAFKTPVGAKIEKMLLPGYNKTVEPVIKVSTYSNKYDLDFGLDMNYGSDSDNSDEEYVMDEEEKEIYNKSYYKKYFVSCNETFNFSPSPLPNGAHIVSREIFCGGAGGTGKTHGLLSSKIFMNVNKYLLYSSSCWDLIQDKAKEFNVYGLSIPKLTGSMGKSKVEKYETGFIKYKVIDELTLNNKTIIDNIIKDDGARSFIFLLGDIDYDGFYYQCSIEKKNIFNPSIRPNIQYIQYLKTYRFNAELDIKLKKLRELMKSIPDDHELYRASKNLFYSSYKTYADVNFNSDDIGVSALRPINKDCEDSSLNGTCKYSQYFYDKGAEKQYYRKDTFFKQGIFKGAKVGEEVDSKNKVCSLFRSIHSFQGRQLSQDNKLIILLNSNFDRNLLYTALSRARRLDQINIIEDFTYKTDSHPNTYYEMFGMGKIINSLCIPKKKIICYD